MLSLRTSVPSGAPLASKSGIRTLQRRRIEQRARELVRAGLARLFDDGDRERLAALGLLQLRQAQRR